MKSVLQKPAAIVVTTLLVLTILLIQSRDPNLALYNRILAMLGSFDLYDTKLTRDVLSARAGMLPSYDSLAVERVQVMNTLDSIHDAMAGSPDADVHFRPRIDSLRTSEDIKLNDVEHFKSVNALLRNSLMYATFTGPNLDLQDDEKALVADTRALSYAVLRLMQVPDPDTEIQINKILARLAAASPNHRDLATLVAHGQLILKLAPAADARLKQIVEAPIGTLTGELRAAVMERADALESRAQVFRILLYAMALILLLYVVVQFYRIRASSFELRRTNTHLEREIEAHAIAATALRASEARLRAISDSAQEAIVSIDANGIIVSWNAGAAAMFGYSVDVIVGEALNSLWPDRDQPDFVRTLEYYFGRTNTHTDSTTRELVGLRCGGGEFPLEVSMSTWETDEGRFLTAFMRDISERKRLEEITRQQELQLIQTNRMAVLGLLISGVAHEINNPNQLIMMNSNVVAQACNDMLSTLASLQLQRSEIRIGGLTLDEARDQLPVLSRDINDAAVRIRNIVDELKFFFRPKLHRSLEAFSINDAARRAVRLLNHLIFSKTQDFRLQLGADLSPALGDAQHLEQAVVNLLVNALDALPDASRSVSLTTSYDDTTDRLMLAIEDQGIGIPQADVARLCDPFFTTKQATGGTGLGLAITSTLLKSMGGEIRFESQVGAGTRVIVTLPRSGERSAAVAP